MPRGGPRPNSGRPKKSIAHHLLSGTFRKSRHAQLAANLAPMSEAPGWFPEPGQVQLLGLRARGRLAAVLEGWQLSALEGHQLLDALQTLTRIEQLEDAIAKAGVIVGRRPNPLLVALTREHRTFAAQWGALRLGGSDGHSPAA